MSTEKYGINFTPEINQNNELESQNKLILEPQHIEHVPQVKESEQTFAYIRSQLESFTAPNQELINLAQQYIRQLQQEADLAQGLRDEQFPKSLKRQLFKEFGGCVGCGQGVLVAMSRNDEILQPHHIRPREYGGQTIPENAMLVCRSCHGKIHA